MEGRAPRFPDPTLEAIANEFVEVLRVKRDAEEKLVELFDKFAEEFVGHEQRFSDQEIRAIAEEIEAMRAMIATRAEPELEPGVNIAAPAPPPHILPYFEDINSGYLHWVLRNIDNDQVRATARLPRRLKAICPHQQRRRSCIEQAVPAKQMVRVDASAPGFSRWRRRLSRSVATA
jgi:hypothetical protein